MQTGTLRCQDGMFSRENSAISDAAELAELEEHCTLCLYLLQLHCLYHQIIARTFLPILSLLLHFLRCRLKTVALYIKNSLLRLRQCHNHSIRYRL